MRPLVTIFLLSFWLTCALGQEKHFVFIQSDNKQPFYVSLNGKLYSSSGTGYVIIPKLTQGTYNLTVGFAQNTFPEQTFSVELANKDLGFDLKNFNEKGWGLFNLQTLDITMAASGNSNVVAKALTESARANNAEPVISFDKKKTPAAETKPEDILPNAAITSNVDTKEHAAKVDTAPANNKKPGADVSILSEPETKTTGAATAEANTSDVKKVSEVSGAEGVQLRYTEGSGKNKDTILITIPSSPVAASSPVSNTLETTSASKNAASLPTSSSATASTASDLKFLDITGGSGKDTVRPATTPGEASRVLENSNCKNVATDEDYARLRRKMAMETTDEKMINEARKYYRNKCFTTSQIKGLSTLFLSDEGRYKFFDASFVSVADAGEYYTLQSEFIDPAYAGRFKALLQ